VLGVVPGKRGAAHVLTLLRQVKRQLQGRVPGLVSSDEFASYRTLLRRVWPAAPRPTRPDKRCTRRTRRLLPSSTHTRPDPALNYVTARKRRVAGRVVGVDPTVVFGTQRSVATALRRSTASHAINTSFLERHNATGRHRNARKARRSYRFSKDWLAHEAVTYFTYYTYNFCWCVRTLARRLPADNRTRRRRRRDPRRRRYEPRTPAMAAGLADHVWSLAEWLEYPVTGLAT
jgi:hypothetical protein